MNAARSAVDVLFDLDPPGTRRLRLTFLALWLVDAVAAALFFKVSHARELNPITVLSYEAVGTPGVALAAAAYAVIVVALGNVLSDPWDGRFVGGVSVLYAIFAINNVPLILFGEPIVFAAV